MQKNLQQLDLFGAPEPAAPKEKAAVPVAPVVQEKPVVFADDRIVVKIKEKISATKEVPVKTAGKRGRKSYREIDTEIDLIDVPDEEVLQQKLYYSISEVAAWFKVNTSLLRYWENEFDILQPRKTKKGDRLFRVEDIRNLQLIYFLLRQRKFSIEGARNYIRHHKKQVDIQSQLVRSLTKFKSFLLEWKTNLGS